MVLQIPRGVRAEVPEEVDLWTVAQADWRSAEEAERAGGCGVGGGARNGRPRSLSYPEGPLWGPSSSHRLCRWQLTSWFKGGSSPERTAGCTESGEEPFLVPRDTARHRTGNPLPFPPT